MTMLGTDAHKKVQFKIHMEQLSAGGMHEAERILHAHAQCMQCMVCAYPASWSSERDFKSMAWEAQSDARLKRN